LRYRTLGRISFRDTIMIMTPGLRKFALTTHVTSSVGWLGAVGAFLALAIAGVASYDAQIVRAAYLAMHLTTWVVIVPLSLAALLTGIVQSVGTTRGLFRHYFAWRPHAAPPWDAVVRRRRRAHLKSVITPAVFAPSRAGPLGRQLGLSEPSAWLAAADLHQRLNCQTDSVVAVR
jgi:hypothetical protein